MLCWGFYSNVYVATYITYTSKSFFFVFFETREHSNCNFITVYALILSCTQTVKHFVQMMYTYQFPSLNIILYIMTNNPKGVLVVLISMLYGIGVWIVHFVSCRVCLWRYLLRCVWTLQREWSTWQKRSLFTEILQQETACEYVLLKCSKYSRMHNIL